MVFGYKKPRIFFLSGAKLTLLFCYAVYNYIIYAAPKTYSSSLIQTILSVPESHRISRFMRVTDFRRLFTACSNHRRSGICYVSITLPRRIPYLILSHYIPLYLIMQDIYLCLFITVNFPYSTAPVHAKAHNTYLFHLPAVPHVFPFG